MIVSRPWLAFVIALFCLPLFVGLGRTDVGSDEAIYTFSVDRILEIGDWLTPKSIPHEDAAFLEKPPLKFWIVAVPIRLGLLPHNEFGTRFWDALFGAFAFVYVFAIGSRLAGPVCGAVALLILFVHWPLLLEHGLRSNNMEAPLFLCYCGGMYHFLQWARRSPDLKGGVTVWSGASGHAVAVGLYFVLGFMTKFVAAIFLPLVVGAAALLLPSSRASLRRDWRLWGGVSGLVLLLVAPWFVYATISFGSYFWQVMVAEHVVTRFRTFLNPAHVQPWSFYFTEVYHRFEDSGSEWPVAIGLVLIASQTVRRRWLDGALVVVWFALPVILISLGTSKLYHYVYPFLPPLALAAGYFAAFVVRLAPAPLGRVLQTVYGFAAERVPALNAACRRGPVRVVLLTIAAASVLVGAGSLIYGPIRLSVDGTMLFRSSGVVRPGAAILLFGLLAGAGRRASRIVVALLVTSVLPLQAYRELLPRLTLEQHPMRRATECLARVQSEVGGSRPGLYVDVPGEFISHPVYYYFRRVRPWTRLEAPDPAAIARVVEDPVKWRPMLVWDKTYQSFMNAQPSRLPSPPMIALPDVVLLLPGPYAVCATAP